MASSFPVSHPSPNFPLPSQNAAIATSGFLTVTHSHPPNHKSPNNVSKFRIKISNHLSIAKEVDSSVVGRNNGSESSPNPGPVSDRSNQKSPKINPLKFRIKINTKISDDPSVARKSNASEPSPIMKAEFSPVIDTQPPQAPTDQTAVVNINHVPKVAKNNQKKRRFSVTLSREEIEEDIAAIKALAGLKRLRRPKKRDQPSNIDQRQLDRLFPGLGYC